MQVLVKLDHRSVESFWLEKTLEVIESDCSLSIAKSPTKAVRGHLSNPSRYSDSTAALGSLFQRQPLQQSNFLTPNVNLLWHSLRPFPLFPSLVT